MRINELIAGLREGGIKIVGKKLYIPLTALDWCPMCTGFGEPGAGVHALKMLNVAIEVAKGMGLDGIAVEISEDHQILQTITENGKKCWPVATQDGGECLAVPDIEGVTWIRRAGK